MVSIKISENIAKEIISVKPKMIKPFLGRCYKKKYYIYYNHPVSGKITKLSTKTRIRTEAEVVFRKFMCQYGLNDNSITSTVNKKISDLRDLILFSNSRLKSPSTLSLYKLSLEHFIEIVGDKHIPEVTRYECDIFMNEILLGRSKATVNLYFRNMRSAFNIAVSYGLITENPFKYLRELVIPGNTRPIISRDEMEALFNVIDNDTMLRLAKFAVLSGMRLGEIAHLQWEDIDLECKVIFVRNKTEHNTKTRKDRKIPLTEAILQILKAPQNGNVFDIQSGKDFVFCKSNGFRYSSSHISHKFKEYVRKAKINDKICFHCSRHTSATLMSNSNIPLDVVQKALGQSSQKTTALYLHTDMDVMKHYMEKVDFGI